MKYAFGLSVVMTMVVVSTTLLHAQSPTPLPTDRSARIAGLIGTADIAKITTELATKEDINSRLSSGDTPLVVAVALNKKSVVESLIQRGATVDGTTQVGWTPLMTAIFYGNREIAELLMAKGAKTNITAEDGSSPRSIAEYKNDAVLLAKITAPAETRRPVPADLLNAVMAGDSQAIKTLLASGIPAKTTDTNGTPLTVFAVAGGDLSILQQLLKAGAPADMAGADGITALMVAVQQRREDAVRVLLDAGADPARRAGQGASAIRVADAIGATDIAKMLRARSKQDDSATLGELLRMASTDDADGVAKLISDGANPDGGIQDGKKTVPLVVASYRSSRKVVALLLSKGANINQADQAGTTALMASVIGKHEMLATELIKNGADSTVQNLAGLSATDMARAVGWVSLGNKQLITRDEFVEAVKKGQLQRVTQLYRDDWAKYQDNTGWVPLLYAIKSGNADVVKFLLGRGVPIKYPLYSAPFPLQLAVDMGNLEIVDRLLVSGADPLQFIIDGKISREIAVAKGLNPIASRLRVAEKEPVKRLTVGLVSLGFLDSVSEEWNPKIKDAFQSFYSKYIGRINTLSGPITLVSDLRNFSADQGIKAITFIQQQVFSACNQFSQTANIAMATMGHYDAVPRQVSVNAWYQIKPGQCKILGEVRGNDYLIFADLDSAQKWNGDWTFCIPATGEILNSYVAEKGSQCGSGLRKATFRRMSPSTDSFPAVLK